ncbi:MAG: dTDP-4-dehydrorhamnose reductase [candidate division Zixibacteria bacterium]|nr:dTDP-4-dehydrorhamnose reductase [candidate division Zixibacteria bacterium]
MKILVTGSQGMLGRDLLACLAQEGYAVVGIDLPELDITKAEDVFFCLGEVRPDIVINCAAYTAVDQAEREADLAFAVNRDGSANLAEACGCLGLPLVHLSTDYVFNGYSDRPYREEDLANPISVYGRSKWEGEEVIRAKLVKYLILRTSWLYGVNGNNFVKTILRLAREREELRVVVDQQGCPTWTGDLAEALRVLIGRICEDQKKVEWGTYHFCGDGFTTWYDFAREILIRSSVLRTPTKVKLVPVTTGEYPTLAQRPKWSVLDCGKIQEVFGISSKPWREGLESMISDLPKRDRTK